MLTKIDICSMALLKLGERPIQSLMDDSAPAQLARTLFDPIVDSLIAAHPWRFATKSYTLTRNSDDEFLIPSDCLRVLQCRGEIQGNKVVAPTDSITILALTRPAVDAFPNYFATLCATKLAMEFCIPLSGEQTVFRMLAALYETELQSAKFIDSAVSNASNRIDNFSLISARF